MFSARCVPRRRALDKPGAQNTQYCSFENNLPQKNIAIVSFYVPFLDCPQLLGHSLGFTIEASKYTQAPQSTRRNCRAFPKLTHTFIKKKCLPWRSSMRLYTCTYTCTKGLCVHVYSYRYSIRVYMYIHDVYTRVCMMYIMAILVYLLMTRGHVDRPTLPVNSSTTRVHTCTHVYTRVPARYWYRCTCTLEIPVPVFSFFQGMPYR